MSLENLSYLEQTIQRTTTKVEGLRLIFNSMPSKDRPETGEFRVEFVMPRQRWVSAIYPATPDPSDSINLILDKEDDWAVLDIWRNSIATTIAAYEKRIAEMRAHLKQRLLEYIEEV